MNTQNEDSLSLSLALSLSDMSAVSHLCQQPRPDEWKFVDGENVFFFSLNPRLSAEGEMMKTAVSIVGHSSCLWATVNNYSGITNFKMSFDLILCYLRVHNTRWFYFISCCDGKFSDTCHCNLNRPWAVSGDNDVSNLTKYTADAAIFVFSCSDKMKSEGHLVGQN